MQRVDNLAKYLPAHRTEAVADVLAEIRIRHASCVLWRNAAPWEVPWRRVPDTMLLIPLRGCVSLHTRTGHFEACPGHMLALPDQVRHRLVLGRGTSTLDQFAVHCEASDAVGGPVFGRLAQPTVVLPTGTDWLEQLHRLAWLEAAGAPAAARRGELFLRQLLCALAEMGELPGAATRRVDARISEALHRIHTAFAEDLGVAGLANEAGLSEVQFRKLFVQAVGTTPRRYLVRYRLREAARMLESERTAANVIATRVGFHSDHYFHRCFHQMFGCTATAYRREQSRGERI